MDKSKIIIGQEDNLAICKKAIRETKKNHGSIIGISGESGVGKSFFLNHLIDKLQPENELNPVLVECQAPIGNFNVANIKPLDPFSRAIHHIMNKSNLTAQQKFGRNVALTLFSSLPLIGDAFYAAKELGRDWRQYKKDKTSENPDKAQNVTVDYFDSLQALADKQKLVILFDDFHWADPQSVELINMLIDNISELPILIIFTYSQSIVDNQTLPLGTILNNNTDKKNYSELALEPFDLDQISVYCSKMMDYYIPNPEFEQWVLDKSFGVQGVVAEYIRYFKQYPPFDAQGNLVTNFEDNEYLPSSLQMLFSRELDEMTEEDKNIFAICSAEGKIFTAVVVSQLLNQDILTTIKRLRKLQKSGIIKSMGPKVKYGIKTTCYRFTQAFYHTYFEQSLEYEEYVALHGQIAAFLKQKFEETDNAALKDEIAPFLAAHSSEAEDQDTAKDMLIKAAQAAEKYGNDDVINAALTTLKGLGQLSNADLQNISSNPKLSEMAGVHQDFSGGVITVSNEFVNTEQPEDFYTSRKILVQLYHSEKYAKLILTASNYLDKHGDELRYSEKIQINAMIAKAHIELGNITESFEYVQDAVDLADKSGDPQSECIALNISGIYLFATGKIREAQNTLEKAAKLSLELPPELRLLTLTNIAVSMKNISPDIAGKYYNAARKLASNLNFQDFANDILGSYN